MSNPYAPEPYGTEQFPSRAPMRPDQRPQVCLWFKVYCSAFAMLYILCSVGGVFLVIFASDIASAGMDGARNYEAERRGNIAGGVIMSILSVPLAVLFLAGLFLPRRKWAWVYGFIPIAIGLTSPCCIPASLPLLIFWLKPNTKWWFNAL